MENSIHPSLVGRATPSKDDVAGVSEGDESGWTKYFDDFLSPENREASENSSGYWGSSSLVSDAASCAIAWKKNNRAENSNMPTKCCKNLSFKKWRAGCSLEDDSLEDTASSPVNSPKVSVQQKLGLQLRKEENNINNFQHEREMGSGVCSEMGVDSGGDGKDEMGFIGNEETDLKKRGLCLVPLSLLANYLG